MWEFERERERGDEDGGGGEGLGFHGSKSKQCLFELSFPISK